jgi:mono/diheme cytochrome c family protein
MAVQTPIEARETRVPAWAIWITVLLFLIGGFYLVTNLAGENPPLAIPGASAPPGSAAPDPEVGRALIAQAQPQCAACHGQSWEGGVGPALTGVATEGPRSENLQDLATQHPEDWMALWIDGTGPEVQGIDRMGMPAFGTQFTPDQIRSIVEFLKTL